MIQIGENCRAGKFGKENPLMRSIITGSVCAVTVAFTGSHGASAQPSYYDDIACRQYADSQIAPLRDQVNSQAVGNTLLGAGLGAALGAAVGGGRGAGIGAASGAILGTGAGVANAQNAEDYLQQQYNAYYAQCMSARTAPPPRYGAPPPSQPTAGQLNQQQLNQGAPPAGY